MVFLLWWLIGFGTALACLCDVKSWWEVSWGDLGLAALLGMAGPILSIIAFAPRCIYDHTFWNAPILKRNKRKGLW